jgi:hypothetical protein
MCCCLDVTLVVCFALHAKRRVDFVWIDTNGEYHLPYHHFVLALSLLCKALGLWALLRESQSSPFTNTFALPGGKSDLVI